MQKLFAVAVVVLSCAAFAQDQAQAPAKGQAQAQAGGKWQPPVVTKKDTKGVDAMWKEFGAAFMKGDVAKAAEHIDFPVLMVTDDGKGNTMSVSWDKDTWVKNMTQSMNAMPHDKNMKMSMKHSNEFLANDLVWATDTTTMTMGKKHMTTKSGAMLIHKDGKWMIKSMVEGGWGGVMGEGQAQK